MSDKNDDVVNDDVLNDDAVDDDVTGDDVSNDDGVNGDAADDDMQNGNADDDDVDDDDTGTDAGDVTPGAFCGITLTSPVVRGERVITFVDIGDAIKHAGSLRGLSLVEVIGMKTDAMVTLLSRVTTPRLKENELRGLATGDFVALSQAVVPFLMPTPSCTPKDAATEA